MERGTEKKNDDLKVRMQANQTDKERKHRNKGPHIRRLIV
jgi:hypothetical protein